MNENERKRTLTARQEKVAAHLAAGGTIKSANVARATVLKWKQNPVFTARIEELKRDITDRAVSRLSDLLAGQALDLLEERLGARTDDGLPVCSVSDVKTVVEMVVHLKTAADLAARLEELERRAKS